MNTALMPLMESFLAWFSLPSVGLGAVFISGFLASTLLPMGSEPIVMAYLATAPHMFWPTMAVATIGNTLGGMVSYAMGAGLHQVVRRWFQGPESQEREVARAETSSDHRWQRLAQRLGHRYGPRILLLSWVPLIGDPLCAVAGWMRWPFWPSVAYMAIGKLARYIVLSMILLSLIPVSQG
jgi:membrane protein YqaA with SNARE-associated domain